jgi:uncharacterized membrane protein YkoI
MKMTKQLIVLLLAILPLALASTSAVAGDGRHHFAQRGGDAGMSLNQAVQQVQRETGGRVLSADTVSQGGHTVHRIKVLTPSGQVRIVTVDAQSRGR